MPERGEERASKKYQLIPTRTNKDQTEPKGTKEYHELQKKVTQTEGRQKYTFEQIL